MKRFAILSAIFASVLSANASWYWPFSSDDEDEGPRLSELMEPASLLVDDATDLVEDGKIHEAIDKYREALGELLKVEQNYPERAKTTEFASLRNKRAYVNAAIDSLLLAEARGNAKSVAITDTTELEQKFLDRRGLLPKVEKVMMAPEPKQSVQPKEAESGIAAEGGKTESELAQSQPEIALNDRQLSSAKLAAFLKKEPKNRKVRLALIGEYLKERKFDKAQAEVDVLLKAKMTDSSALNLKAVCEVLQGDCVAAEKTLDFAIQANPRDYNSYYNMASLKLQTGNVTQARYYYETGRAVGGPKDAELEAEVAE